MLFVRNLCGLSPKCEDSNTNKQKIVLMIIKGVGGLAIVVTGGTGYIGSHVCVELIIAGYDIAIIDNYSNSNEVVLERIKKITGIRPRVYPTDLLNRNAVKDVFRQEKVEAVIHLAGFKAVSESVLIPIKYYHNNLTGTFHLLQAMQLSGVKKLVFSSSATVYGNPKHVPITENMLLGATNPYGWTKLMLEQVLRDIAAADSEWSIPLLRYFNPIGAHPSGLIGEAPRGIPNNLVPYITQVAVGKLERLKVYGNDYPTRDGTGVRDYIHVVDLARGHLAALRHALKVNGADAFNLGAGRGYSVLEVISAFERASGVTIPYEIVARRPGDIAACYADPGKAGTVLGWYAEGGLDEMCADAWRWQLNHPNGYK